MRHSLVPRADNLAGQDVSAAQDESILRNLRRRLAASGNILARILESQNGENRNIDLPSPRDDSDSNHNRLHSHTGCIG